ncbi:hypothetical protein [Lactococcus petauri]|uniref:hypothetical protein n=1 Tax=Lactococcus petauri TaxID=1940789 RepID=UPI0031FE82D8
MNYKKIFSWLLISSIIILVVLVTLTLILGYEGLTGFWLQTIGISFIINIISTLFLMLFFENRDEKVRQRRIELVNHKILHDTREMWRLLLNLYKATSPVPVRENYSLLENFSKNYEAIASQIDKIDWYSGSGTIYGNPENVKGNRTAIPWYELYYQVLVEYKKSLSENEKHYFLDVSHDVLLIMEEISNIPDNYINLLAQLKSLNQAAPGGLYPGEKALTSDIRKLVKNVGKTIDLLSKNLNSKGIPSTDFSIGEGYFREDIAPKSGSSILKS